jgi:amino acid permease
MPIVLTEAFGCNKCQQIFVVEENGHALEQLSTTYPYKRAWHWTGTKWSKAYPRIRDSYLPVALLIIVVLFVIGLFMAPYFPKEPHIIIGFIMGAMVALMPIFLMCWLAYRR